MLCSIKCFSYSVNLPSSVALIIGSLIGNHQYWLIFCLIGISTLSMLVADYLLIKFFGGFLVVKKPYLIQTLSYTVTFQTSLSLPL